VLTDPAVHDALEDSYDWSFAGPRRLKGIDGSVKLWRCRRLE
jgi:class 3 adenylate cyclase